MSDIVEVGRIRGLIPSWDIVLPVVLYILLLPFLALFPMEMHYRSKSNAVLALAANVIPGTRLSQCEFDNIERAADQYDFDAASPNIFRLLRDWNRNYLIEQPSCK